MISIQVLCHVVDLTHGFCHKFWENDLFTLEKIGTCVKITWNYCLVLHKVKSFHRLCARFCAVIIVDFYIDDFIFALFYLHERRQSC